MDDDDVFEIPPPTHLIQKQKKHAVLHDVIVIDDDHSTDEKVSISNKRKTHQVIFHDVIDIENDDNSEGLIAEKVSKSNTGKKEIGSSSPYYANIKDGIKRKSRSSKQFGIANDASDHHIFHKTSHTKQHPENWTEEIQKEWQTLKQYMPSELDIYEQNVPPLHPKDRTEEIQKEWLKKYMPNIYEQNVPPLHPKDRTEEIQKEWLKKYMPNIYEQNVPPLHPKDWTEEIQKELQSLKKYMPNIYEQNVPPLHPKDRTEEILKEWQSLKKYMPNIYEQNVPPYILKIGLKKSKKN